MGSNVTFYPQDTVDKSRHQWICLAAASISRKMDNWTLLSAGFDVGEKTDGRFKDDCKAKGRVGTEEGRGRCMYAREKSKDWAR